MRCDSLNNQTVWGDISNSFRAAWLRAAAINLEYSRRWSSGNCSIAGTRPSVIATAASTSSPPPWASKDSIASCGSRDARSRSVIFGIPAGPTTYGRWIMPPPISMGAADQVAVAGSGDTTSKRKGHRWRDRAVVTYTGQVNRLRSSGRSWASTTTPKTGLGFAVGWVNTTTASALYSVGTRSFNVASESLASAKSGSSTLKSWVNRFAASPGCSRTSAIRPSCRSDGMGCADHSSRARSSRRRSSMAILVGGWRVCPKTGQKLRTAARLAGRTERRGRPALERPPRIRGRAAPAASRCTYRSGSLDARTSALRARLGG